MKPVPDEKPASFEDVLAAEYKALRPDAGFESGDERDLIARMHRDPQPLAALCISGGGIRSATFALGVIQGLAERGLLPRFDYLSTVSGGGYIGGWLTAWSHRAGGIGSVASRLCRNAPAPPAGGLNPLHYLREYNSYMSPRTGLFSNDVWTLVAIFVRNMLLNWTVLIPLLMAVLMVPRLYLATLSFPERLFPQILAVSQPDWANPALDVISASVWPPRCSSRCCICPASAASTIRATSSRCRCSPPSSAR
jgi:Patatin-like phospholipase